MKILPRVISVASILVGLFLVSRSFVVEERYAKTMPRDRDVAANRIVPMLVDHETQVFVTDAEAKSLDATQTYFTFGWPFVVLGVLLAVASRERRPPTTLAERAESEDGPWSERR